jgi:hypothetical protein
MVSSKGSLLDWEFRDLGYVVRIIKTLTPQKSLNLLELFINLKYQVLDLNFF